MYNNRASEANNLYSPLHFQINKKTRTCLPKLLKARHNTIGVVQDKWGRKISAWVLLLLLIQDIGKVVFFQGSGTLLNAAIFHQYFCS